MSNIFDLGLQRNWKQAVCFHLFYFFSFLIAGFILGVVLALLFPETITSEVGYRLGVAIGIIASACMAIMVIRKKKLYRNAGFILLGLSAPFLAIFGGALLGLIPVAFLTTRGNL